MHYVFLAPTGWGFMLLHKWRDSNAMTVTDGGSYTSCLQPTLNAIGGFLQHEANPHDRWAWILSHIDYDHYSLTVALIKAGLWSKPKIVVLPAVYSSKVCREALEEYHKLALIVAAMLRLPPPSFRDLAEVTSNTKRLGVGQGARLYARELLYHILWPPTSGIWPLCEKLLERLRGKLNKAMVKCKKMLGEKVCREAMERGELEAGKLLEALEPEEVVEVIDLDRELRIGDAENSELYRGDQWIETERPTYGYIFIEAVQELKDEELLQLHRDIVNNFSLAYTIEQRGRNHIRILPFKVLNHLIPCILKIRCYGLASSNSLLLYPSDLGGEALTQTIRYYKQHYGHHPQTIIEVAAHHGNAYTSELQGITSLIVFLPRCNRHVPKALRRNFRYWQLFGDLSVCLGIYSGHMYGLEVKIWL